MHEGEFIILMDADGSISLEDLTKSIDFMDFYDFIIFDRYSNPLKNYQYFTQADITKAKKDLGFEPEFNLRSGIRKMIHASEIS